MKWIRILGLLLILSLCANLYLVFVVIPGPGGDLAEFSGRVNMLESENARLSLLLDRDNITLGSYQNLLAMYRQRLQEFTGLLTPSPSGPIGFAVIQGPAVLQQVQYNGNNRGQVVQSGVMLNISAEVKPGKGRVLVDTKPLMGLVFQDAANTAVYVAQNRTGVPLTGSDVIFSISAPGQVPAVDGPSAGALMTLLAIAAIENKPLREDITLTGTIDKDGKIGAIGGVVEKSQAAKDSGKSLILLPRANAKLLQYTQQAREYHGYTLIQQVPQTFDTKNYIESKIGVKVEYVDTIDDVLRLSSQT